MYILMLAHVIAPSGGIEAALVDLTQALVEAGHRVEVYACRPFEKPNQNVERLLRAGAALRTCPTWLARLASPEESQKAAILNRMLNLLTPLLAPVAVVDAIARRRPLSRSLTGIRGKLYGWIMPRLNLHRLFYVPADMKWMQRKPDVVHVHGWGCGIDPPGALAWAHAKGLPTVYTEHNSPPEPPPGLTSPSWVHLADRIIACSHAGARGLSKVCCAKSPITVIPYSVADPVPPNHTPVQRSTHDITFTCLARLNVVQKRQDDLIRAFHDLSVDTRVPVRLLLAGDGPDRKLLEQMVADLALTDIVELLGVVTRDRLPWLMAETDVLVLPSSWEGLPVSIIEALAFGKPVIASDAGGNPELVLDGQTGLIIPIGRVDMLKHAMQQLIDEPQLRHNMGKFARKHFDRGTFLPETIAASTLAVYQQAIETQQ